MSQSLSPESVKYYACRPFNIFITNALLFSTKAELRKKVESLKKGYERVKAGYKNAEEKLKLTLSTGLL